MKTPIRSLALACTLLLGGLSQAQDKAPASPDQLAKNRAECYAKALGLKDKEMALLLPALTDGELKVAELRTAIAELQAQIEASLAESDAGAEANLTEAQLAKLAELRKTGWKPCSEDCTSAEAKASCAGKTDAKGACCAGGAKAAAPKTDAPAPKPNATMK